jgi:dTDP-4-amino-4,6-dideoxygalactose transaminase
VVAVSSCTAAIEIAVAHLGLPRGSRIGVPTWTFVSTALAPYHRGVLPVPLDVEPDDLNLSLEALERAIDDLDAVIGVHFGGVPFRKEIRDLCATKGVPLIEDAAHALGAQDDRGTIAGQGTAGCCWSFYATKNLTSAEGGALATDDPELARFARSFRLHGLSEDAWARYDPRAKVATYDVLGDGLKANLPDVLAALARVQLARFPAMQERRAELVARYRRNIARLDGLRCVPPERAANGADHLMMVLLPQGTDRTDVRRRMQAAGVGTSVHFRPLHTFGWFDREGLAPGPGGTPVADRYAERALSLPLHTRLSDDEVDRVCDALADALAAR